MLLFYQWLFAHLLGDFVLQPRRMVHHKKRFRQRSWMLYQHGMIHAMLVWLLVPDSSNWAVPLVVFVTHCSIDIWKVYRNNNLLNFALDQLAHVLVLLITWLLFYQPAGWWHTHVQQLLHNKQVWLAGSGYLFIIFPLSRLLGFATQRWRDEVEESFKRSAITLSEAGKWIGIFERVLVYTFVLTHHFEGIGFLIAAKSILRFTDIKGSNVRKEAEYVLIGTLMSFACSIATGLAVKLLAP